MVFKVKLPTGKTVTQALAEKWPKKDSRIIHVEPNYRVRLLAEPDDARFSELWGLNNTGQTSGVIDADIDAPEAWDITTGSTDVVIAVIDTGVDYTHPDLAANMWINTGEIADNNIDDDGNGYIDDIYGYDFVGDDGDPNDDHSHGTHVAGTIGAVGNNSIGVAGINWQCRIMACKSFDASGEGTVADILEGTYYAIDNGARVLSNSWAFDYGEYLHSMRIAIEYARDNGVLFIAAASNDYANNDIWPIYPASYQISNIIAVAATDRDDDLASFSNYGLATVHLGAPGVGILSTIPGNSYAGKSGTSMATPHVSGVAGLVIANNHGISLNELKARIIYGGDDVASLSDKTLSGKRLNAYGSLTIPAGLTVKSPSGQEVLAKSNSPRIIWSSIGGGVTVDIDLFKAGVFYEQLADDIPNTGIFTWEIPENIEIGADYRIIIDDGNNIDQSDTAFSIIDPNEYFTELFESLVNDFDLSNKSVILTPDVNSDYTVCVIDINSLFTDPTDGNDLALGDDDYLPVSLSGDLVSLYDVNYSSFYVGSNGYITFESGDASYLVSMEKHFSMKRISGMFTDLDPSSGGTVRYEQLQDRIAVTWENVPEYGSCNPNTFQIEMFFDGILRLSWLTVIADDGVVGLSTGPGSVPIDFGQSDFSDDYVYCVPFCGDSAHPYPIGDLNMDCVVNFEDAALIFHHWLDCTKPECN